MVKLDLLIDLIFPTIFSKLDLWVVLLLRQSSGSSQYGSAEGGWLVVLGLFGF